MNTESLIAGLTPPAQTEPDSGIVNVVMYGMAKPGTIGFWSGQGNLPTPEAFYRPVSESLQQGETFYTWQLGIPELRQALADYHTRHFDRVFDAENFCVTGGGMQAIQIALQMIAGAGDEIIIPAPAWPNYAGPMRLMGVRPVEVPMLFENNRWSLDLDRLFAAASPHTKAICINSPSNPIGWTAAREDLIAIRDFARARDIWILADEVYSQFYFGADGAKRAPSFLDVCDTEEKLILCNTFSKNWAMTGWRQGWIQVPKALAPVAERFIQYHSSGSPVFLQRGCATALNTGDGFIAEQVATARRNRDIVAEAFRPFNSIDFQMPDGAFYFFFRMRGVTNSLSVAKQIIDDVGVGFAPGAAFGAAGEGFMRMCYLKDEAVLREGLARFSGWLRKREA